VLTCTRGELGEVIPTDIKDLEGTERLAGLRERELAAAMGILGVRDHRFLGSTGARWRDRPSRSYTDSGMRWGAAGAEATETVGPDCLTAADFGEVAADIAAVIEATRPTAVISYDATGGYGHPDHVRAHEAARRAAEVMEVPFFAIEPDDASHGIGLATAVDISPVFDRKRAAMLAHRSQITVDGDTFALSSGPFRPIPRIERFRRVIDAPSSGFAWKWQGLGVHIVVYLLAIIIGAALGGIVTVGHQLTIPLFGGRFPAGIVVALVIAAALLIGSRLVFGGRLVALFAAIGLVGVIGVLSLAGSGGGVLVPANPAGYLLTYGTAAIALVSLAWPSPGTFRRDKLKTRTEPKGTPSS